MIAWSELGQGLIDASDNGFNVLVGSRPSMPILFTNYADHPRLAVQIRPGLVSTAAGRYQILKRIFDHYKRTLNLPDFSPASQDKIAVQLIKECRAMQDIEAGRIELAIIRCRSRWASLPAAGYGQHENKMAALIAAYTQAGGNLA
jgi:muramidase (phage lysozyme)